MVGSERRHVLSSVSLLSFIALIPRKLLKGIIVPESRASRFLLRLAIRRRTQPASRPALTDPQAKNEHNLNIIGLHAQDSNGSVSVAGILAPTHGP